MSGLQFFIKQFLKIIYILGTIYIVILLCMVFAPSDGCFLRYTDIRNPFANGKQVVLMADGNYTRTATLTGDYGEWLDTGIFLESKTIIEVEGETSLCKGFIAPNNLYQTSDLDKNGKKIEVPRITDQGLGIPLVLDDQNKWRNVIEVFTWDEVNFFIGPNIDKSATVFNIFTQNNNSASCLEGQSVYSPLCGRYSPYGGQYTSQFKCNRRTQPYCTDGRMNLSGNNKTFLNQRLDCDQYDSSKNVGGCDVTNPELCLYACCSSWKIGFCDNTDHRCERAVVERRWDPSEKSDIRLPYLNNGSRTAPYFNEGDYDNNKKIIDSLQNEFTKPIKISVRGNCSKEECQPSYSCEDYKPWKRSCCSYEDYGTTFDSQRPESSSWFWFTADKATGLIYRFSISGNNDVELGNAAVKSITSPDNSGYRFMSISDNQQLNAQSAKLLDKINVNDERIRQRQDSKGYLQLRLYKPTNALGQSTGGYVVYLKHTKCKRKNGNFAKDTFENRGRISYLLLNTNPNKTNYTIKPKFVEYTDEPNNPNSQKFSIDPSNEEKSQKLWLRIHNNPDDYKNSYGSYNVKINSASRQPDNNDNFFGNSIQSAVDRSIDVGKNIFKTMTCYQNSEFNCIDLFLYIKALMIGYVMFYGIGYSIGIIKLDALDLVKRFIKLILVAGLLQPTTFELFNEYVFDTFIQFLAQTMSAINGYVADSSKPFTTITLGFFKVLDETIFYESFAARFFSTLSFGPFGIFYICIIGGSLIIIIMAICQVIVSILFSVLFLTVLIGLAPIFLTFILFEKTKYLFDSWLGFSLKTMIEPLILGIGVGVLIHLYAIYLDNVLGFSVCWKCLWIINFPFIGLKLFCLSWLAPWGYDPSDVFSIGMNMVYMFGLIIISYCTMGYLDAATFIISKLSLGMGYSASGMGVSSIITTAATKFTLKKLDKEDDPNATMSKIIIGLYAKGIKNAPNIESHTEKIKNGSNKIQNKIANMTKKKE